MPERIEKVTIKAFRAVEFREYTIRYVVEHHRVLEDIGVTSSLKMDYGWCLDPETTLIVAFHEELGMVGGCRIQLARDHRELPFYKHVLGCEPDLGVKLEDVWSDRCCELAGLWVAHRFAGNGLPWFLTAAAVSILGRINARNVLCLAAEYSTNYAVRNGFEVIPTIGKEGKVEFPIPGICSYALINRSVGMLERAVPEERERLTSLCDQPEQVRLEGLKDRMLEVTYRLSMTQRMTPLLPLRNGVPLPKRRMA
jgi:hypothetical protein